MLAQRYSLGERLGEGGFGIVYSAFDNELRRSVAVKLLDPAQEVRSSSHAARLRERFRREAIATASVDHPNVVTIYDVGVDDEKVFIVMELLEGSTLAKELALWPTGMRPERVIPLFVDALRGLHAGHVAGVVHKDLKPGNLFVAEPRTARERLYIIDFGVARVVHEEKLTATGKIVGSPRYLAPEYIEHLAVTPRVDVYQMGLILVECLAGLPCVPRRLDLVSCCQRHRDGKLKIPEGLRTGAIGEIVLRATASDPDDRFQTAAQFADALEKIDPTMVRPEGPGKSTSTPRLGIAPLSKDTMPMHGGASEVPTPPAPDVPEPSPRQREYRPTGPTKQIGPANRARLEEMLESSEQPETDRPQQVESTATQISPEGRPTAYTVVYALIALAAVSALSTFAFLLLAEPPVDETNPVSLGATVAQAARALDEASDPPAPDSQAPQVAPTADQGHELASPEEEAGSEVKAAQPSERAPGRATRPSWPKPRPPATAKPAAKDEPKPAPQPEPDDSMLILD